MAYKRAGWRFPGWLVRNLEETQPLVLRTALALNPAHLAGTTILHVNHLLQDILHFNEVLAAGGAEVIYIPIDYGARALYSPEVASVQARPHSDSGMDRNGPAAWSRRQSGLKDREAIALVLEEHIRKFAERRVGRLILLEDGAYQCELNPEVLKSCNVWAAVEQTTNGLVKLQSLVSRDHNIEYPVVSIARSRVKMRVESWYVGLRVIDEAAELLRGLGRFLANRAVLVFGYGVIGRAVCHAARGRGCRVIVYDTDPFVAQAASEEGFEIIEGPDPLVFENHPVVVGAAGADVFSEEWMRAFCRSSAAEVVLVSGSSERVEFSSVVSTLERARDEEEKNDGRCEDLFSIIRDWTTCAGHHFELLTNGTRKVIHLLADGYPVNFFRRESQSLPDRVSDLVNTELLIAVHYLTRTRLLPRRSVYLFGVENLPDLEIKEEELVSEWARSNGVRPPARGEDWWSVFTPHPCERRLLTKSKVE